MLFQSFHQFSSSQILLQDYTFYIIIFLFKNLKNYQISLSSELNVR